MASESTDDEGRPPFFRTWRGAYALVVGVLVAEVALLGWLSWSFA